MKKSTFYAVSTGPGKGELLTLEAIRNLNECDIIFYPESKKNSVALSSILETKRIDFSKKELIPCKFSMSGESGKTSSEYEKIILECESFLREGKSVAMLSIGDVSLYSSAARTGRLIQAQGFDVKFIAGVNSFSQAACAANLSLCERDEKLSVIPADSFYEKGKLKAELTGSGTKILMKAGKHLKKIIALISECDLIEKSFLVQKVSLPDEKIFFGKEMLEMSESDFEKAYLSLIIVKSQD